MQCVRTLPPALFNSKSKGIERHVPRMQMSKQFLTLTTNFLLLIIKQEYGEEYRKKLLQQMYFAEKQALQKLGQ